MTFKYFLFGPAGFFRQPALGSPEQRDRADEMDVKLS